MSDDFERFFRISKLPPYALGSTAARVAEARAAKRDIIDLSQVNPNLGPPGRAVDSLIQACLQPHNHRYSASQGIRRLRAAAAQWYEHRHAVSLDPETEVCVTMGTKEGLSHLLLAMLAPGESALVPTPSYPIHTSAVTLAGAGFVGVPLYKKGDEERIGCGGEGLELTAESDVFFDRLRFTYMRTWPRPRVMVLSFPHNPTTAVVDRGFFERLVEFAKTHEIYLVHDFAYAELCFDGHPAPSILSVPGGRDVAVECYSLSKTCGLPGWRIGFCLGSPPLVAALKKIKSYLDFGIFQPLQIAAAKLLEMPSYVEDEVIAENIETYRHRRDVLVSGLRGLGWQVPSPRASVFVWARLPEAFLGDGSLEFCNRLLDRSGIAVCPGIGFDAAADSFVRFALVEPEQRLRQAVSGIGDFLAAGGR